MNVEQLVEWEFSAEVEVLEEDQPKNHLVHHKPHMT
jgi:hypothetical protein